MSPCYFQLSSWKCKPGRLCDFVCLQRQLGIEQSFKRLKYRPELRKPIETYLRPQGRFGHLFISEEQHPLIEKFQENVDEKWERLLEKAET